MIIFRASVKRVSLGPDLFSEGHQPSEPHWYLHTGMYVCIYIYMDRYKYMYVYIYTLQALIMYTNHMQ